MMIKKLFLGALLLSSVVVHSLTKEDIAKQYDTILDGILHHFDGGTVNNSFYDVCGNWKIAVLLAEKLNPNTKVTDINLIVLVDILNNHSYSSEAKASVQNELVYFQNNCQSEKLDPLTEKTHSLF